MKILFAALILAMGTTPAYAYLDPGTGSMMVQLLIGAVAGGLVVIKVYWYRLKSFLTRSSTEEKSDDKN